MAVLYWIRLSEHTDIFTQGYVGVAADFKKRLRSHKHTFKAIWDQIIAQPILISTTEYCFSIEKKLRPYRKIGWNKAIGGLGNNQMLGKENPNFGQFGEKAPNFIGWYKTPLGIFDRPEDAAKAHDCHPISIARKCKGRIVNGKFLPPQDGFSFIKKA